VTPPDGFKEDPHRVVAFGHCNGVGRFHDGHAESRTSSGRYALASSKSPPALTMVN
jgi:hypothetical protein